MTPLLRENAFAFVDLLFTAALTATLGALAVPPVLGALDEVQTLGAVRFMSSRLHQVRMTAVARSVDIALRFTRDGALVRYGVYADGNDNGLRSVDIADGTDTAIRDPESLSDQFPGVVFGTLPGLPPVDPGGTPPGNDPIRLGSGDLLTFTPLGTASAGSLYILGRKGTQYVIRIVGETGKTRILKFDPRRRQWNPL